MGKISSGIWEKIKANQELPLIGENTPNHGNGYHDAISWVVFAESHSIEYYTNTFYNIYLRDLGLAANPNLRKEKIGDGFQVSNCSDGYLNTLVKYFCENDYRQSIDESLYKLGEWANTLCNFGRIIFEIIGWYDNKDSQFYAFELRCLDNEYCTVNKDHIIFEAPLNESVQETKKVIIPIEKIIVIDFPQALGGYKGFQVKVDEVLNLGERNKYFSAPFTAMEKVEKWDQEFNRLISDWGNNRVEGCTDYYKMLNQFRFHYTALLCMNEVINGFRALIQYLNTKFSENAILKFDINRYSPEYFKDVQRKWEQSDISYKEAKDFLYGF